MTLEQQHPAVTETSAAPLPGRRSDMYCRRMKAGWRLAGLILTTLLLGACSHGEQTA